MNEPQQTQSKPEAGQPLAPTAALDLPRTDIWMNSDHYHCKECGAQLEFWKRIHWRPMVGVRAVGACHNCGVLMLEYENQPSKWVKV